MRYVVRLGDKELGVELVLARGAASCRAKFDDGSERELTILSEQPSLAVALDGRVLELLPAGNGTVSVRGSRQLMDASEQRGRSSARAQKQGGRAGQLLAPMPGRIVKVLVEPNVAVNAGQPALVIEAMKMENELGCPATGTVREVLVKAGDAVEKGAVLVVIQ